MDQVMSKRGDHSAHSGQSATTAGQRGFTLIELMVTVGVIAIIGAIAYPAYVDYARRAERANARASLTNAVQWMERQYGAGSSSGSSYPTALPASVYDTTKYTIGINVRMANSFTLQAQPKPGWGDSKCGTLTLSNTAVQGSSGSESTEYCWSK